MSLIPNTAVEVPGAEFSTSFQPSLAIGGDYFDIVRLKEDQERLAVVIADVAGHGLPAGLRMAMLKAAVQVLVRERKQPEKILDALDDIVRSGPTRAFVTATLSLIDLRTGIVDIINAGHPPVYHVRQGEVEEVLLPSTPLGTLGNDYGKAQLKLEPGDRLIWLSDGLIEATNSDDEAFGFHRIHELLEDQPEDRDSHGVRDAFIQAVQRHTQDGPADDDRTLVVMRYLDEPVPDAQDP